MSFTFFLVHHLCLINFLHFGEVHPACLLKRVEEGENHLSWVHSHDSTLKDAFESLFLERNLLDLFKAVPLQDEDVGKHQSGHIVVSGFSNETACCILFLHVPNFKGA